MIRACHGVDPNLTREIPAAQFDPLRMILSPWNQSAPEGQVTINCHCGLEFDDVDRSVIWPHRLLIPVLPPPA